MAVLGGGQAAGACLGGGVWERVLSQQQTSVLSQQQKKKTSAFITQQQHSLSTIIIIFMEAAKAADLTQASEIPARYIILGARVMISRNAGLGRTRLFHPWRRKPEEGWSGSDVSVSHVVRQGLSWTQVSHLRCLIVTGFDNGTMTFRIDHTPLHRIAVQFEWA